MGHSLPAPLGHGPCGPLGAPEGPGLTDRVSHQPHAPAVLGGCAVRRSPELPGGVRRETSQGCPPVSCLPPRPLLFLPHHPRREMKAPVGRCSLPGWCHGPPVSHAWREQRGRTDGRTGSSYTTVPCSLETRRRPRARGTGGGGRWWWWRQLSVSRANLPRSSSPSPGSPPRMHPMTPSLGTTPDEAQVPAGPLSPQGWPYLGGSQSCGLSDLGRPGVRISPGSGSWAWISP